MMLFCLHFNFSFDRRLKVHPNGTLSIKTVTEKDGGDYLCIARNKVADDYRLLRVSVATKSAKIEPKQPLNQMVLLGKPLKVSPLELYLSVCETYLVFFLTWILCRLWMGCQKFQQLQAFFVLLTQTDSKKKIKTCQVVNYQQ